MSDYDALCSQIAGYANREDWPQSLLDFFVLQAEQKLNADLRVDRMITTVQNLVNCQCSDLPDDWLEADMVWISNTALPTGLAPIRYMPRDEFFRKQATASSNISYQTGRTTMGYYTIEGRTIWFGGPPDAVNGVLYRMAYYGEVPVMAAAGSSWVYDKHPRLYLFAALSNADFHAVGEEQNAMLLGQEVDKMIAKLNANHRLAKASGSRLARTRTRSFG